MVKLIDQQKGKYTLIINGKECIFMQMNLFLSNSFLPLKPFVPKNKSVIKWKVNGKQISYNQIKAAIYEGAQVSDTTMSNSSTEA